MIDPLKLEEWDRIVYGNNNRWSCVKRIDDFCDCGLPVRGWVMNDRSQYQVWWDDQKGLWEKCISLREWLKQERKNKKRK